MSDDDDPDVEVVDADQPSMTLVFQAHNVPIPIDDEEETEPVMVDLQVGPCGSKWTLQYYFQNHHLQVFCDCDKVLCTAPPCSIVCVHSSIA